MLIDDKKARDIAESFDIKCIGSLGILSAAKSKGYIKELRPIFIEFLRNERYYAVSLLNTILVKHNEEKISINKL